MRPIAEKSALKQNLIGISGMRGKTTEIMAVSVLPLSPRSHHTPPSIYFNER